MANDDKSSKYYSRAQPPSYEPVLEEQEKQVFETRDDGRVDIDLNSRLVRRLSLLAPQSAPHRQSKPSLDYGDAPPKYTEISSKGLRLNIVIQVVGSRGDVQPFVALGTELQRHGHRVRLATHNNFEGFVRGSGLEFYPIGGSPEELMAYMVKNPGLVPSMSSLRAGDIQKKRKMVAEMLDGCWKSCIEPDQVSGKPFVAEAIIANPPSFAHVHCAQVLGVPLHLMFTMPWTSTKEFCHPLANLHSGAQSAASQGAGNFVSYAVVEWLTWQGLGDIINAWRDSLDLQQVPFSEGAGLVEALNIPFTYCWSPALIPKPADWADHIDVCGFFFRDPPDYTPPTDLDQFLRGGSRPVYIGFGSIVIDDPDKMTSMLVEAVKATGTRAIISRGWSKLGANQPHDDDIFYLGDCPHEWLFQHVAMVMHHGGAGTTACGLLNGRPTSIVPFFGDQPFWGKMVAAAGAGPEPIPYKLLSSTNIADAIRFCLEPSVEAAAAVMSRKMKSESGVRRAVASFHANLPLEKMRCDFLPNMPAAWTFKTKGQYYKLSKPAAEILTRHTRLKWSDIKSYEPNPIHIENRRWDPVTAVAQTLAATGAGMVTSAADIVAKPIQVIHEASTRGRSGSPDSRNNAEAQGARDSADSELYGRPAGITVQEADHKSSGGNVVGSALAGSASGVGGFFKHFSKGISMDLPFAVSEGMRNAPRLYGGQVYDPGAVTDWKSGGIAAGKNFSHGIVEGIGGLVMEPVRGAKSDGARGAAKGAAVGLLNMGAKVSSGVLGLVTFPSQGVYQSARASVKSTTRRGIKEARRHEGETLIGVGKSVEDDLDQGRVLQAFDALR